MRQGRGEKDSLTNSQAEHKKFKKDRWFGKQFVAPTLFDRLFIRLELAEKEIDFIQYSSQIKRQKDITTVRDQFHSFAVIPTSLISHYPLPLS